MSYSLVLGTLHWLVAADYAVHCLLLLNSFGGSLCLGHLDRYGLIQLISRLLNLLPEAQLWHINLATPYICLLAPSEVVKVVDVRRSVYVHDYIGPSEVV